MDQDKIKLFEDQPIRTAWDEEHEEWYFSIVDVIAALTEQPDSRHASTYWAVLKKRLKDEGADRVDADDNTDYPLDSVIWINDNSSVIGLLILKYGCNYQIMRSYSGISLLQQLARLHTISLEI